MILVGNYEKLVGLSSKLSKNIQVYVILCVCLCVRAYLRVCVCVCTVLVSRISFIYDLLFNFMALKMKMWQRR